MLLFQNRKNRNLPPFFSMKFGYEYVLGRIPGLMSLQPQVLITFTNPENKKGITVNALVDSGAKR
jgi:hypothetical protein